MIINGQSDVKVHLKTKIRQGNDIEDFQFDTDGQLLLKNGALYLRYTEIIDDQTTQVMFKIDDERVRLNRSGETTTKLAFVKSQRVPALYQTPAGQMQIETLTTLLANHFDLANWRGEVDVDYVLYANQQIVGQYEIRLQFSAKSSMLD